MSKTRPARVELSSLRDELSGAVALFHSLSEPTRLAEQLLFVTGQAVALWLGYCVDSGDNG